MTEDEAKLKWCPYVQIVFGSARSVYDNRGDVTDSPKCLGSECMAWRWSDTSKAYLKGRNPSGHCGLGGKP